MPPLVAIAAGVLPSVIDLIMGDKAARVAGTVADAVVRVTGTDDPSLVTAAITDPAKRVELQTRLAEIVLDEKRANLESVANARAMTGQSPMVARAQVTGAAVVLAVWCFLVIRLATQGPPPGSVELYLTIFAGVSGLLGGLHQFFYGNSTAAHAANQRLDKLAEYVGTGASQPSAIATTAPVTVNNPSPPGTTTDVLNDAEYARTRS